MRSKKIILLVLAAVIIAGFLSLLLLRKHSNVLIVSSPSAAKLVVDNKQAIPVGNTYLKPGKHTIKASFSGFNDVSKTFTVASKGSTTVTLYLVPNSQAGYDYLNKHPDEASSREDIGSSQFQADGQQRNTNSPIVKILPYISAGNDFRIDYGAEQGDNASTSKYALYVTYYVAGGDQEALTWIRQQGYDPATYQILYTDKSASDPQVTNNPNTN